MLTKLPLHAVPSGRFPSVLGGEEARKGRVWPGLCRSKSARRVGQGWSERTHSKLCMTPSVASILLSSSCMCHVAPTCHSHPNPKLAHEHGNPGANGWAMKVWTHPQLTCTNSVHLSTLYACFHTACRCNMLFYCLTSSTYCIAWGQPADLGLETLQYIVFFDPPGFCMHSAW